MITVHEQPVPGLTTMLLHQLQLSNTVTTLLTTCSEGVAQPSDIEMLEEGCAANNYTL